MRFPQVELHYLVSRRSNSAKAAIRSLLQLFIGLFTSKLSKLA